MLLLKEIYESLKMDGLSIGRLMTFINFHEEGTAKVKMDVHDILKLVKGFGNTNVCLIGNPLYQERSELEDLIELLYAKRYSIMIETDEMHIPSSIMRDLVAMWEIKPNLPSSGIIAEHDRLLMIVKYLGIRMQFKFIVEDEKDIVYMRDLLEYVADYQLSITPKNGRPSSIQQIYEDTKNMLKGYNISYLPRLDSIMEVK
jgi:organic radical activating enzyme